MYGAGFDAGSGVPGAMNEGMAALCDVPAPADAWNGEADARSGVEVDAADALLRRTGIRVDKRPRHTLKQHKHLGHTKACAVELEVASGGV